MKPILSNFISQAKQSSDALREPNHVAIPLLDSKEAHPVETILGPREDRDALITAISAAKTNKQEEINSALQIVLQWLAKLVSFATDELVRSEFKEQAQRQEQYFNLLDGLINFVSDDKLKDKFAENWNTAKLPGDLQSFLDHNAKAALDKITSIME